MRQHLVLITAIMFTLMEFRGRSHSRKWFVTRLATMVNAGTAGCLVMAKPGGVERFRHTTLGSNVSLGIVEVTAHVIQGDRDIAGPRMKGHKVDTRTGQPGEQLIVSGLQKIRDGAPVMAAPPAGAEPQAPKAP